MSPINSVFEVNSCQIIIQLEKSNPISKYLHGNTFTYKIELETAGKSIKDYRCGLVHQLRLSKEFIESFKCI